MRSQCAMRWLSQFVTNVLIGLLSLVWSVLPWLTLETLYDVISWQLLLSGSKGRKKEHTRFRDGNRIFGNWKAKEQYQYYQNLIGITWCLFDTNSICWTLYHVLFWTVLNKVIMQIGDEISHSATYYIVHEQWSQQQKITFDCSYKLTIPLCDCSFNKSENIHDPLWTELNMCCATSPGTQYPDLRAQLVCYRICNSNKVLFIFYHKDLIKIVKYYTRRPKKIQ